MSFLHVASIDEIVFTKPGWYTLAVDSEIAQYLLLKNVNNRKRGRSSIDFHKRNLRNNFFMHNHPHAILFSWDGVLMDGQHRLSAIADAKISSTSAIVMRIETGLDPQVRDTLDVGRPRALQDCVVLDNDHSFNEFIVKLLNLDFLIRDDHVGSISRKPTAQDAREFRDLHKEALRLVYARHKKEKSLGQVPVTLAAMQYYERDATRADEFYKDLFMSPGEGGSCQQAQMLREFLYRFLGRSGGRKFREEVFAKTVGCMHAHERGIRVSKVLRGTWDTK
jgi:hypothetical protein